MSITHNVKMDTGIFGDSHLNQLKIVIADDSPAILHQMVHLLEAEFTVVATAENGLSALDLIRQHRPDVAVLDLNMPVVSGLEVIRQLTWCASTPRIVICSAESDPEIIQSTRQAGALGYVFKTSMIQDLMAAVKAAARGEVFVSSL
jgi:two-component system nitrate/nitrite response regulator NarL